MPAWANTVRIFGYTNHTLLPECFRRGRSILFASVLPRQIEMITRSTRRFLDDVRVRYLGDDAQARARCR